MPQTFHAVSVEESVLAGECWDCGSIWAFKIQTNQTAKSTFPSRRHFLVYYQSWKRFIHSGYLDVVISSNACFKYEHTFPRWCYRWSIDLEKISPNTPNCNILTESDFQMEPYNRSPTNQTTNNPNGGEKANLKMSHTNGHPRSRKANLATNWNFTLQPPTREKADQYLVMTESCDRGDFVG